MAHLTGNFIITGTAGTGKTSLIDLLRQRGYVAFDEAQRAILTEQTAVDGPALPAKHPELFIEATLNHCIACLNEASATLSFFDRGIPDVAAYARRFGVDPSRCFAVSELQQYNKSAFLLPPWPEIFETDPMRGKSFAEYQDFHALIVACYQQAGFALIEVPRCSLEDRAEFILERISALGVGSE